MRVLGTARLDLTGGEFWHADDRERSRPLRLEGVGLKNRFWMAMDSLRGTKVEWRAEAECDRIVHCGGADVFENLRGLLISAVKSSRSGRVIAAYEVDLTEGKPRFSEWMAAHEAGLHDGCAGALQGRLFGALRLSGGGEAILAIPDRRGPLAVTCHSEILVEAISNHIVRKSEGDLGQGSAYPYAELYCNADSVRETPEGMRAQDFAAVRILLSELAVKVEFRPFDHRAEAARM